MKPKKTKTKKHIHLVVPEITVPAPDSPPVASIPAEHLEASAAPVQELRPAEAVKKPAKKLRKKTAQASAKVDHRQIAAQIADELGETKTWPRNQIRRIIWALGLRQTQDLVRRAKEINAAGGMMIPSGTRRRTVGGIFFYLVYSEGKPREGRVLTRPEWKPRVSPLDQEQPETAGAPEDLAEEPVSSTEG